MRYPSTSDTLVVTPCAVKRARRIDAPIRPIAGVSWKSWLWPTQVACDVGLSDATSSSTPAHASMPTRSTRFDRQRIEITWVVRQVVMCAKLLGAEFVRSNNRRHDSKLASQRAALNGSCASKGNQIGWFPKNSANGSFLQGTGVMIARSPGRRLLSSSGVRAHRS